MGQRGQKRRKAKAEELKRKQREKFQRKQQAIAEGRCTCPAYGGFAEAVPDEVWRSHEASKKCSVHNK